MTMNILQKLNGFKASNGPVVTVILDGVGLGSRDERDGVLVAHTPVLDRLFEEPLYTELKAHGTAVGLPSDEDMGNSEVGHNALGTDITTIKQSMDTNPVNVILAACLQQSIEMINM